MSAIKRKFGPFFVGVEQLGVANGVPQLDAQGKLPASYIPAAALGGLNFKGLFDASAGSYPASPANGDFYLVGTAGTISGSVFTVGDGLFYSTALSAWEKLDISRTTDELPEGTVSLYFTPARAQAAAVLDSLVTSTTQAPSTRAVIAALALKANATTPFKERKVLSATDVTNGYVVLSKLCLPNRMHAAVQGLGMLEEVTDGTNGDYVLSTDSGSGNTKFTWKNDLVTGGASPVAANDAFYFEYAY